MFVGKLNDAQRRSFMALVTKMALADAKVKPEEVNVLEEFTAMIGAGMKIPPEAIYGPTNVEVFDTRESRVIVILAMLVVAFSDEHFHIDEPTVLNDTAAAFNFGGDELTRLRTWAQTNAAQFSDFQAIAGAK